MFFFYYRCRAVSFVLRFLRSKRNGLKDIYLELGDKEQDPDTIFSERINLSVYYKLILFISHIEDI